MEKETLIKVINEQNNSADEREQSIHNLAQSWGYFAFMLILALLLIFRAIAGIDFVSDVFMIFMGQSSFVMLFKYLQDKEKKQYLYFSIFEFIIFLVAMYQTLVLYEIL